MSEQCASAIETDLHGKEDEFKSGCAWCGEPIPPNEYRRSDKFGNLYCSTDCYAEGFAELFERAAKGAV